MSAKERLGENIRKAYYGCGKSTRQIQIESGLDRTTVIRWINGTHIPNALKLKAFCDVTHTSVSDIYKGV